MHIFGREEYMARQWPLAEWIWRLVLQTRNSLAIAAPSFWMKRP